jgi:class 3 adenylate cyclase
MTDPRVEAWTAAGLYDALVARADDRLALLQWLDEQGVTLEEMVAAHAEGRLFAVVGDRILRGGDRRLTSEECAAAAGMSRQRFLAIWRTLGFPDPGPHDRLLTAAEAATFSIVALADSVLGESGSDRLSTTISRAMRIVAEATNMAFIEADDSTMLDRSGSELTTAQTDALYDGMIPSFHQWLLVLHALHHESSNRHLELAFGLGDRGDEAVRLAVGFGDVTGYTSLSNRLPSAAFASVVSAFEAWAADAVRQGGAHLVKTLGDGLMFVGSVEAVGRTAVRLVEPGAAPADLRLHAGVAYGAVLAAGGDYFGPVVNLAARLCGAAPDGVVLADTSTAEAWGAVGTATPRGSRALKGIDQAVDLWALELEAGTHAADA